MGLVKLPIAYRRQQAAPQILLPRQEHWQCCERWVGPSAIPGQARGLNVAGSGLDQKRLQLTVKLHIALGDKALVIALDRANIVEVIHHGATGLRQALVTEIGAGIDLIDHGAVAKMEPGHRVGGILAALCVHQLVKHSLAD